MEKGAVQLDGPSVPSPAVSGTVAFESSRAAEFRAT